MSDRFKQLMERRAYRRSCRCCDGSKGFKTKNVRTELKRELRNEIKEEIADVA